MIFEFSAVFTCYLTYYKPIAKKDCLARPRARRGRAVRAKWIINIIFEFSAVFTCYLTYYKPIAKKDCLARLGRAVGVRCARNELSTSFLNSVPFLPAIWHTISLLPKKVGLARPCAPGRARGRAESIFNIIFEFSAVFTCYLTYYKPIAKKHCLARLHARKIDFQHHIWIQHRFYLLFDIL